MQQPGNERRRVGSDGARGSKQPPRGGPSPKRRAPERRTPTGPTPACEAGPPIPDWARANLLEDAIRDELASLAPPHASRVAGHLVAAGEFLGDDPQLALSHARAARASASRLACVREAAGVAAYHAGEYVEASRELRAYRRMSGRDDYLAVLADCERAAGRPDAALRLLAEAPRAHPGQAEWVEQRIVEAGARRDLGEVSGAILVLRDALRAMRDAGRVDPVDLIRLRYAYADGLAAADRTEEARAEFAVIAESDDSGMTDAAQRAGTAREQA